MFVIEVTSSGRDDEQFNLANDQQDQLLVSHTGSIITVVAWGRRSNGTDH